LMGFPSLYPSYKLHCPQNAGIDGFNIQNQGD
jgi:hypothetical protein